ALVLLGAMAKSTAAEDYPWGPSEEALHEARRELIAPLWGEGAEVEIFMPSVAHERRARELVARLEQSVSPMRLEQLFRMFLETDVRQALPLIQAPTLVLHRRHDPVVNVRAARWLAAQIAGSRYVEFDGRDHMAWVGDNSDEILDEIEEFLTGVRPAPAVTRVLATVLFTDICDSSRRATELGDRRWRSLLEQHQLLVREQLERFDGREVKTTGDGFLASFDGPGRAIECASEIVRETPSLGLDVRAGLHSGEVELLGDDVGGIAVHAAARVCELADPGVVLVSRTVHDLVAGSQIEFADQGTRQLKGIPGDWQLYSVEATD
ncbi:MAG: adenylate/guanylate cyclase domain-containing protein, partial [Nocardioidaceae bacterium]